MKQLLIVEDHALYRRGLLDFLNDSQAYHVMGEAASVREAEEYLQKHSDKIDGILLDISLPKESGLKGFSRLKSYVPNKPIVFLTMHHEPDFLKRALELGASGFVTKDLANGELLRALDAVFSGLTHFSCRSQDASLETFRLEPDSEILKKLTARELEVLEGIVAGKNLTSLAQDFGISIKTVSTHKTRLLVKLKMKTSADLIRWALRQKNSTTP